MSLTSQFKEKLKLLKSKLEKASKAYKYTAELIISGLKTISLEDPVRNIFAKHEFINQESFAKLKLLINELNIFYKHEEIILYDDKRIQKALEILNVFEDQINDILATLQARAIFLENLLR
ncbi:MAG: hypothetical protein A3I68_00170 [Candidatus Melainabacteria bacterium RIFCSPLOWO2_02_FULL_35_15]|nr:MAG: hypothetical protein A3F80_00950 [Candidatus Melainabacteria bacterium RIFCSPLOWO2_12_FULL_35_11]OGI14809.1 MAG: hypothetical protein A3I68_00170 [Candidatus Melainabacteria bacterium RIFCSPLOWO2_02_FULL_35_15]